MKHKRKIEIICIDCKERICSNCALFDEHRLHNIKMETEVLEEITTRSECLMEMYQMIEASASEKPDEAKVDMINQQFQSKYQLLRGQLAQVLVKILITVV